MKKNIAFLTVIAVIIAAAAVHFKIVAPKDFYGGDDPFWKEGDYIVLSVECASAAEHPELFPEELRKEKYIPKDGFILEPSKIALKENDTALSVLVRTLKYLEIPFDIQGADENSLGTAYVRGINQLYEFSGGELSGWMYCVNGEFPPVGCESMKLKSGDEVRFIYTVDLGKSEGGNFE